MARSVVWLVELEFSFVGLGLLASSCLPMERRPHFWSRVGLCLLAMVALALTATEAWMTGLLSDHLLGVVWLLLAIAALLVGPAFCYRRSAARGSDSDGGGGGSGPEPPPPAPIRPSGGIPLEHADQATVRVRGHDRPGFARPSERRRAREPGRTPARRG